MQGTEIKKLLIDRGMKQYQLADRLGMRETALSKLLTGRQKLSPEQAAKIASVLGLSADNAAEAVPA